MMSLFTTRTRSISLVFGIVACFLFFVGCTIPAWITYRKDTQVLYGGLFMTCIGYQFNTCTTKFSKDNLYTASQILGSLGLFADVIFVISASLTFFWTTHWKILKILKLVAGSCTLVTGILITLAILTLLQSNISLYKSLSYCGYLGLVSCVVAFLLTPFYVVDGIKTTKQHKTPTDNRQKRWDRTEPEKVTNIPPDYSFILDRSPLGQSSRDLEEESKETICYKSIGQTKEEGRNKKIKKGRLVNNKKEKQNMKKYLDENSKDTPNLNASSPSTSFNLQAYQSSKEKSLDLTNTSGGNERRDEHSLNSDLKTNMGNSFDNFVKSNPTCIESELIHQPEGPFDDCKVRSKESIDKEKLPAIPSNKQTESFGNRQTDITTSFIYDKRTMLGKSVTQNRQKKGLTTKEKKTRKDLPQFFKDKLNDTGDFISVSKMDMEQGSQTEIYRRQIQNEEEKVTKNMEHPIELSLLNSEEK